MAFEDMDEEGIIKTYAMFIAGDIDMGQRIQVHERLCELMDCDYDNFKPFENIGIKNLPTEKEAERMLRKAISEFKKVLNTNIPTKTEEQNG